MIVKCQCGAEFDLPTSFVGQAAECSECKKALQLVVGMLPFDAVGAGDFAARLVVESGPADKGHQFLLAGTMPIEIGKTPTRAIMLQGAKVSRCHCRLIRTDDTQAAWRIEDSGSTNGTFVNRQRAKSHDLRPGDVLQIGEFTLRYLSDHTPADHEERTQSAQEGEEVILLTEEASGPAELPELPTLTEAAPGQPDLLPDDLYALAPEPEPTQAKIAVVLPKPPPEALARPTCPSCQRTLGPGAKICVQCGIDLKTGKPLLTSQGLDENEIEIKAENTIRIISWLIPIGPFYPVASDAFGTKKPHTIRTIALLTLIFSGLFWMASLSNDGPSDDLDQLMLWPPSPPTQAQIAQFEKRVEEFQDDQRAHTRSRRVRERRLAEAQAALEQFRAAAKESRFRWYQLITHAFLHGDLMHIAGNLLFMMVFGSRVNALIGNIQTIILYPLLAIAAAAAHLFLDVGGYAPMLGASGAIMGLAGMYFVFFPVHRVYMVSWWRLGLFGGFHLNYKVYSMRGFWVVLIYIGFDVLATVLQSQDGVAHWAHLGGFIVGMVVAFALMLSRLVDARGGDILSRMLGRHAWALLGRPADKPALSAEPATAKVAG